MTIKAVILDVYNTLFRNDLAAWLDTFKAICDSQGIAVAPEDLYDHWKSIEVRFRQTRTNLDSPEQSPPFSTYQSAWRSAFIDAFSDLNLRADADAAAQASVDGLASRQPFPDALPFLDYVSSRYKVALLTNADNASILPLVERHNLAFDALLTSEMARAYKPDPRVFQQVAEQLGVPPSESLYVGDTLFDDVHGAKLAGMYAAWINRARADRDTTLIAPDHEVAGLDELADILKARRNAND